MSGTLLSFFLLSASALKKFSKTNLLTPLLLLLIGISSSPVIDTLLNTSIHLSDSALGITINGFYKTEVIHKDGPWKGLEQVELATLDWVDWFKNKRLLSSIGDIPPAEYEENYYRQLSDDQAA